MATGVSVLETKLSGTSKAGRIGVGVFGVALIIGFIYAALHLVGDLAGTQTGEIMPYVLLGIALAGGTRF